MMWKYEARLELVGLCQKPTSRLLSYRSLDHTFREIPSPDRLSFPLVVWVAVLVNLG